MLKRFVALLGMALLAALLPTAPSAGQQLEPAAAPGLNTPIERMFTPQPEAMDTIDIAAIPDGEGWFLAELDGEVKTGPTNMPVAPSRPVSFRLPTVAVDVSPSGDGWWLASGGGEIHAEGDARSFGEITFPLNRPVVDMDATEGGGGYWMAAADGGVFAFGDAPFLGSAASLPLVAPIIGFSQAKGQNGYWLAATDGGVFTYGAARFFGSAAELNLVAPIVDIVSTSSGQGYWLLAADGGVFAYGDARFLGSAYTLPNRPDAGQFVAISRVGTSGYRIVDMSGNVLTFTSGAESQVTPAIRQPNPEDISLPPGYEIEPIATGLTYLTSVALDDQGAIYVAEAGGHTYGTRPENAPPPRIVKVLPDGRTQVVFDEVVPLADIQAAKIPEEIPEGLIAPITGLTWHEGKLFVTHRTRVSTLDPATGKFQTIIDGLPAWGEFQNNKVIFGPDGKMYFFVSSQTNAAVIDGHTLKVLQIYNKPHQSEVPCEDVTLTGVDYTFPNPFTQAPDDVATYDAYVEFGRNVPPGTVIKGKIPCNGAFFKANADGSGLELVAWGLRSDFGYRFNSQGQLISTQNSCNPLKPRDIFDAPEAIYHVQPGVWYGWPDYCAGIPVTDDRFAAPSPSDIQRAPEPHQFVLTEETRNRLLRGRTEPVQPLMTLPSHTAIEGFVFGKTPFGIPEDDMLVTQFGTVVTFQHDELPGFRVVKVDLDTKTVQDFAVNTSQRPDSVVPDKGGLERPLQMEFDPTDPRRLYLVDFGVIDVDAGGLNAIPHTGILWRITKAS